MSGVKTVLVGELMVARGGSVNPAQFQDEDFDVYSIPAFDAGAPEIAKGSAIGSTKQIVRPNDVLLSKIVPHIRRAWVVGADRGRRLIGSGEWIIFRSDRAHPAYLKQVLVGDPFHEQFMQTVSGVGGSLLRARPAFVAAIPIPLPPLPEQRRIAAILNQAEALRTQRRAALAQLDSLTQALFLDMFGDPVTNPKDWPVVSLTDICHCYSGGTPSKANSAFWEGPVPWFSAKDMKAEDLFESEDHIAETVPQTTTLKLLPKDTVAIVVRGMILAHTFPVCVLRIPATINQDLKALIPAQPINAQFLAACLRSQAGFVLEQVSEAGHGTKRLDARGLQKIRVLRPEPALEQTFATRVHAIESLRAKHRAALAELDALFASLQKRAFTGHL